MGLIRFRIVLNFLRTVFENPRWILPSGPWDEARKPTVIATTSYPGKMIPGEYFPGK